MITNTAVPSHVCRFAWFVAAEGPSRQRGGALPVCPCVCMSVCLYVHMYGYACVYAGIYACTRCKHDSDCRVEAITGVMAEHVNHLKSDYCKTHRLIVKWLVVKWPGAKLCGINIQNCGYPSKNKRETAAMLMDTNHRIISGPAPLGKFLRGWAGAPASSCAGEGFLTRSWSSGA